MEARETPLRKLLDAQQQFIVPLFQRAYGWKEKHWNTLWRDILRTHEAGEDRRHFLGSMVTKPLHGQPEGVSPYLLIDGQQRLTTLTLVLAAMRDACRGDNPDLAEKIDDLYLKNRHASGADSYKVLPTQDDRLAYFAILDDGGTGQRSTKIDRAYRFFRSKFAGSSAEDDALTPTKLASTILNGLEFVSITLGEGDDEYAIFESLNAKGMPLGQVDLIRNYFFMRVALTRQDVVYADLWRPMESLLGEHLEGFFRYDLMSGGRFVREDAVYQEWKGELDLLSEDELVERLGVFVRRAGYYKRMVDPKHEPDPGIRRRFQRLNRLGSRTLFPFLLFAYEKYQEGATDPAGFERLLGVVESFLVRRLFARVPTNQLNRLFIALPQQLPDGVDLVDGLRTVLSVPGRRWPGDEDFRNGVLFYPLYTDSRPDQRKLILETFEESIPHKERPDLKPLTIEHLMPQHLTEEWKEALGPDAEEIHSKLLHVAGNLTLTGYNPDMSNSPWMGKRQWLVESNLQMNKEVAKESVWTAKQILDRGARLAEQAFQLWPGPAKPGGAAEEVAPPPPSRFGLETSSETIRAAWSSGQQQSSWTSEVADQLLARITSDARRALKYLATHAPAVSFEQLQEHMQIGGVAIGGVMASFGFAENAGLPRPYQVDRGQRLYLIDPAIAAVVLAAFERYDAGVD